MGLEHCRPWPERGEQQAEQAVKPVARDFQVPSPGVLPSELEYREIKARQRTAIPALQHFPRVAESLARGVVVPELEVGHFIARPECRKVGPRVLDLKVTQANDAAAMFRLFKADQDYILRSYERAAYTAAGGNPSNIQNTQLARAREGKSAALSDVQPLCAASATGLYKCQVAAHLRRNDDLVLLATSPGAVNDFVHRIRLTLDPIDNMSAMGPNYYTEILSVNYTYTSVPAVPGGTDATVLEYDSHRDEQSQVTINETIGGTWPL